MVAAKYRARMGQVQDEVEQLQEKGFIPNTLGVEQIRTDLHLNSCWADAFWRRRDRHSTRSDPEISFLNEENRTQTSGTNYTALEIGSAYGRVTAKLAQPDRFDTITGIEIGTDFEIYCNMYQKIQNYNRERVNFIFDNFFTSNEIQSGSYDLILLPMNTFPSFGIDKLPILLKRVSELLSVTGQFVFSTYPESGNNLRLANQVGELLIDTDQKHTTPLAVEHYNMDDRRKEWGVESVTYSKYTYLDENYPDKSRIFRTTRSFMQHTVLERIIERQNLEVQFRQKIDHSFVFVVSKN